MSFNKRMLSAGAAAEFVASENFKVVAYTGNGISRNIELGFQPDLVWIKSRSVARNHYWYDSTRGVNDQLLSNTNQAEATNADRMTAFNATSFTAGDSSEVNNNAETYVAYCWKAGGGTTSSNTNGSITSTVQANTNAGFSIVQYGGTGSAATVGHGLSSAPELIFSKQKTGNTDWVAGALDWTKYLEPNGTPGFRSASSVWNNTAPSSTVFSVAGSGGSNTSGGTNIAYCFHSVDGFSKIGSYEGNGSTNGPIVNVDFEPAFVMVKNVDSTDNWLIIDNARNTTNPKDKLLQMNLDAAESSEAGAKMNFYSNGFQSVGTGGGAGSGQINSNGDTYLYIAIAADPDEEAPALANSFNIETYTGSGSNRSIAGYGFAPNFLWIKQRSGTEQHYAYDTIRGYSKYLHPNLANAEGTDTSSRLASFDSDGFSLFTDAAVNGSGSTYVAWGWKADDNEPTINDNGDIDSIVSANANAGFSIVKYTHNGTSGATIGHGLSSTPQVVIIKCTSNGSTNWINYYETIGNDSYLTLNLDNDLDNYTDWITVTSTTFSIGAVFGNASTSGREYIAYCWHGVTGYSKFGTYSGNGSTQSITGLGFKPDFIMFKKTSADQDWLMVDSLRGGQKELVPSGTATEYTMSNGVSSFDSDGWSMGANNSLNTSSATYIYMAFKQNVPSNTTLADSFDAVFYAGSGSARSISTFGFRPDFVWMKSLSNATTHELHDSVRPELGRLYSNADSAQSTTANGFVSLDSNGFSLNGTGSGGDVNTYRRSYIAWGWKAGNTWQHNIDGTLASTINVNTANGFSIVKYTGDATNGRTIGHGLGATPEVIFVKNIDAQAAFAVYHGYNTANPETERLKLNTNDATLDTPDYWNDTAPTSSVFTIGTEAAVNTNNQEYIAYCWTPKSGYSKFGSYSGSGSNGNSQTLGFKPDFVMVKRTNDSGGWLMFDGLRSESVINDRIEANNDQAEQTDSGDKWLTFTATTFEANGSDSELNASGSTYIYMAFKKNATNNNTLANSFKAVTWTGNGSTQEITGVGFKADLVWIKERSGTNPHSLFDTIRGAGKMLVPATNAAEINNPGDILGYFLDDGFQINRNHGVHSAYDNANYSGSTYVAWCWKAGNGWEHNIEGTQSSLVNANTANGFSIVKWTTNGSSSQTVGHGLNSTPELVIYKRLDSSQDWFVETNAIDGSYDYGNLNSSAAFTTNESGAWSTRATSTTITNFTSSNNFKYVAYCFHSVTGYSKIGTYSGTGTSSRSFTGVGFQPDFLMIKCTSATAGWHMYDHARGIKKRLKANDSGAEYDEATGGSAGVNSFDTDGWTIGNDTDLNGNNETFIYVAFKAN